MIERQEASSEPLLLMTPGPTRVPERVLRAGSRPMIHHRTPEFSRELGTAIELLRPIFGTTTSPLPVHTTGRGALEAIGIRAMVPGEDSGSYIRRSRVLQGVELKVFETDRERAAVELRRMQIRIVETDDETSES